MNGTNLIEMQIVFLNNFIMILIVFLLIVCY